MVELVNFFANLGRGEGTLHEMGGGGMVVMTEIMRVRRLAKEIEFAFQLVSLYLKLLIIKSQVLVFLL